MKSTTGRSDFFVRGWHCRCHPSTSIHIKCAMVATTLLANGQRTPFYQKEFYARTIEEQANVQWKLWRSSRPKFSLISMHPWSNLTWIVVAAIRPLLMGWLWRYAHHGKLTACWEPKASNIQSISSAMMCISKPIVSTFLQKTPGWVNIFMCTRQTNLCLFMSKSVVWQALLQYNHPRHSHRLIPWTVCEANDAKAEHHLKTDVYTMTKQLLNNYGHWMTIMMHECLN